MLRVPAVPSHNLMSQNLVFCATLFNFLFFSKVLALI
jgi:hypothetical protein